MNTIYRIVWNAATGKWVVASELAKGRKKTSRKALVGALAIALAASAPFGAVFAQGTSTSCTTTDGQSGSLDANGVCTVDTIGVMGAGGIGIMGTSPVATSLAGGSSIDDVDLAIGAGAVTTALGAIAINGDGNYSSTASGAYSIVIGPAATSSGAEAIAIGNRANATNSGTVALGSLASATGSNSVAVGQGSGSNADNGIALGNLANVSAAATGGIALGASAAVSGGNAVAVGLNSTANALNSTAIGPGASAASATTGNVTGSTAIGWAATADGGTTTTGAWSGTAVGTHTKAIGDGATAFGDSATATADRTAAFGRNAQATATQATAFGANTVANQSAATAIGYNAQVTAQNATAIGANSVANVANTVSVGSVGGERNIVNVAAGNLSSTSTDAVNGSQLFATNGNVATNTANIATNTANIAGNTTSITNLTGRVTTSEGNITNLQQAVSQISDGTVGLVQQTAAGANLTVGANTDGATVDFTGTMGTRTLTGVTAGNLSSTSTDAVNGSQLFATNENVATNTANIATNTADIATNTSNIATNTANIAGNTTSITNLDGRVTTSEGNITNLQQAVSEISDGTAGLVQQTAAGANLTVGANTDGATVDFTGTAGTRTLTGVTAGNLSSTSTDAVNGSQLFATNQNVATNTANIATNTANISNLDGRVTTNEGDITSIQSALTELSDGTVGLVQQTAAGANLTVGANTDGTTVDFTGTAGTRTLTGVTAGNLSSTSTDAVNGSQLFATNQNVATNTSNIATNTANIAANTANIATNTANISNLDGRVTTNEGDITNIQGQLNSGTIGLVQQNATTGNITVASSTGGSTVDFTGTDGTRVLTGLANGVNNTDAVTIAQLKALGVDPGGQLLGAIHYDDMTLATATLGGTNGTTLNNLAPGLIASGSMQAVNGGQLFDMQQNFQSQFNSLNSQYASLDGRIGTIEQGVADGTIGGGGGGGVSPGTGDNSTQIGDGAIASGENGTAVGNGAVASGESSTANGAGAVASGSNSTATGVGSQASGSNSTASGANSVASGNNSTANGANASATGTNSTALGANSSATGNNSVALGAGSVADRDNTVSVGSPGNERQITNVAAGTQRTDAANWGQVQDAVNGVQDWANQKFTQMNKRINGMGAMSAAYGQMAFSAQGIDKPNRMGVGVGMQNGQSALAVGYSRQIKPNLNVSFGGSASANDVSVGAGMAFGW